MQNKMLRWHFLKISWAISFMWTPKIGKVSGKRHFHTLPEKSMERNLANTYQKSSCIRCTVALQTQTIVLRHHPTFARPPPPLWVSWLQHPPLQENPIRHSKSSLDVNSSSRPSLNPLPSEIGAIPPCAFLQSVLLSHCNMIIHLSAGRSSASHLNDSQFLSLEIKAIIPVLQGFRKD